MYTILLQTSSTDTANGFFDSSWWNFATLLSKAVLVGLWLALVFWTYKDAKRRLEDSMMIGIAVLSSLIFPYVGTLFYVVLRPPEYLEDVLERELEIRARELEIGGADRCPACRTPIRDDFLICPKCRRQLKMACGSCGKPLSPDWQVCPYCEAEASHAAPASRQATRKTVRTASAPADAAAAAKDEAKPPFAEEDELFA